METADEVRLPVLHELRPHSLGQSVEWKRMKDKKLQASCIGGPTRWGNQLNGNLRQCVFAARNKGGPTRWGNQLNGNQRGAARVFQQSLRAPLAGAIS